MSTTFQIIAKLGRLLRRPQQQQENEEEKDGDQPHALRATAALESDPLLRSSPDDVTRQDAGRVTYSAINAKTIILKKQTSPEKICGTSSSSSPPQQQEEQRQPAQQRGRSSLLQQEWKQQQLSSATTSVQSLVADAAAADWQQAVVATKLSKVSDIIWASKLLQQAAHPAIWNENKYFFLNMNSTRNSSILPGDVVHAAVASLGFPAQHQQHSGESLLTGGSSAGRRRRGSAFWRRWSILPDDIVSVQEPEGVGSTLPGRRSTNTAATSSRSHIEHHHHDRRRVRPQDQHQYYGLGSSKMDSATSAITLPEHLEAEGIASDLPEQQAPLLSSLLAITPPPPTTTTTSRERGRAPCSAYFLLLLAVMTLSSIGPLLQIQQGVDPVLKVAWRSMATVLMLLPLVVGVLCTEGLPHLTWSHWCRVPLAALGLTVLCIYFVLSLQYTSVGNALILSNSQSLMLLIGKFLVGTRVTSLEAFGALVAFGGAILCSIDSSQQEGRGGGNGSTMDAHGADSTNDASSSAAILTFWGDLYGLISAIGGVGYLVFAQSIRKHLNLYIFMFLNMLFTALYSYAFVYSTGSTRITLDFHPNHGVFGWMNADRLPLELTMVVICNLLGGMGYVRAMQYFDSLVISVAALMEPVVAELMACFLGVGLLPGWKGWLGNALVTAGTVAVVYTPADQENQRKEHDDQAHNNDTNNKNCRNENI
ncbi:hypothetical protein ACA910_011610 [Epithemia clementina (nom. ined.)]